MEVTSQEKEDIRNYIIRRSHIKQLENDIDLFKTKVVNSLLVIEFMMFIEKAFQIKIVTQDLNMDNFRTIDNICRFLSDKRTKKNGMVK